MPTHRVALIFGGQSTEHEISIISARAIANHIDTEAYELYPIYVGHDGSWFKGETAQKVLDLDMPAMLANTSADTIRERLREISFSDPRNRFLFDFSEEGIDVALPIIHGSTGEDGKIQGLLDMFSVPYTGCGVHASAMTMDKETTKICAEHAGLHIAPYTTIRKLRYQQDPQQVVSVILEEFTLPFFVKPASQGSSIGITKVHRPEELAAALEKAFMVDTKVLIEKTIEGREIEVAVLGNDSPIASVPGEVEPGGDFYDFTDKYINGKASLHIPARLPEEVLQKVSTEALKAYRALECRGMSRVDFFIEDATGRIILNEINTVPGFTGISMYPMMMDASGIDFSQLIDRLLQLALEKTLS